MTPSSVSLRFLPEAVVSVDDSIVCLTPSSRSVHLLCQTVVSLTPSSLSLGLLSRSRVIGFVWKRQWSVSFIPEPTRVSQKDLTSSKPEPESFQNLLHSHQPNTSFSFVTREPSIELSSSDVSVFGGRLVTEEDNVFDVMKVVVFCIT
ncbi:hypothetical protein F2Q69_00062337 [Brassica cretica]|uniref:Uncharacterized protein n=1 Tax=Brassica cretica TaxID=69181 RepID=A0A8S9RDE3_BRACR|nr:hypothetical protein F2Q69_00062337 [Brassica cretica]